MTDYTNYQLACMECDLIHRGLEFRTSQLLADQHEADTNHLVRVEPQ